MTPQEIAASGLLPGTPVVVTRMVQIGQPLVIWGGSMTGFRGRGGGILPQFMRRDTILMHPIDWWTVFTDRTIWEAVVAVVGEDFDTRWERAAWREIGEDR